MGGRSRITEQGSGTDRAETAESYFRSFRLICVCRYGVLIHTRIQRAHTHTHTLCPPWPLTLNIIVFLLCMPFAAPLLNVSRSGESHGALVMTPKSSSTWESDLYTPPLRCEVRRGRVKKGTAPKNSCQPVGRHSAPLGATKQARDWQRGGQGCGHTRRLLRRQRRLHYWASICLAPLIRLSPFILTN